SCVAYVIYSLSLHDALPIFRHLAEDALAGGRQRDDRPERLGDGVQKVDLLVTVGEFFGGEAGLGLVVEELGECLEQESDFAGRQDRKSTRLNSSHVKISYAV